MSSSYYPSDVLPEGFCVKRARNDLVFTDDGRQYIDLLGGGGTIIVGHANPAIVEGVQDQLSAVWNTGILPTRPGIDARTEVEGFFPSSHHLAGLYSTGMEAAEFALRLARRITGRSGAVGFGGSMHGKSTAAAILGWPNDLLRLPDFHRLPQVPDCSEDESVSRLAATLAKHPISAVFIEPLLGSRGGHIASREFVEEASRLCAEHGSLLVIDEILTGFHRTGPVFMHREFGTTPDIVLIGKAMGNGFPVSGVVIDRRHPIDSGSLPNSTYSGNPLAAAAVVATLKEIRASELPKQVAAIESTIVNELAELREVGIALRGKGALWVLELPPSMKVQEVFSRVLARGVIISPTATFVRLLPPATITSSHLTEACGIIREECLAVG